MLIANPIYDVAFKRLLENNHVAKFLVGTILGCKVITLEHKPQEHTKFDDTGRPTLYRMDFSATIEVEGEGQKTVIIEVQKAKKLADVYRFRQYIGGEYVKSGYPIIAIYILGFNLLVDAPAFTAYPEYEDLQTRQKLEIHDSFVEHLTHKAYFVQTKRIKQSVSTKLDALLSIFGQENFVTADETLKEFPAEVDSPEMKEVLGILHYVAVDADTRKELDEELYYLRAMEGMFGAKDKEIEEKAKKLEEKDKELEEKDKELEEKDKELGEKDKELGEKDKELAELRLETAILMKRGGVSIKEISDKTGIPPEEIEKLYI